MESGPVRVYQVLLVVSVSGLEQLDLCGNEKAAGFLLFSQPEGFKLCVFGLRIEFLFCFCIYCQSLGFRIKLGLSELRREGSHQLPKHSVAPEASTPNHKM